MRKKIHHQLPLAQPYIAHVHAKELEAMDEILSEMPSVLGTIQRELSRGHSARLGREGMTAEQVLRALILKQLNGYSYAELSFHLADSTTYRTFCRLGAFGSSPSRSTLQENFKKISPVTLQRLHEAILRAAEASGMEDGKTTRVDCTVTETNIHEPSDSWLLWDVVRVLTDLMRKARRYGATASDHKRLAKRRFVAIQNAGKMERRIPLYKDLVETAKGCCEEALDVIALLERLDEKPKRVEKLIERLERFESLGRRVIDQTERRVLRNESVPASEKILSIFEDHTDIIIKGRREVEYGHKICLATGISGLITDCVVESGNPADVTLATKMVDRHRALFGRVPERMALDGGFASRANLEEMKNQGVKDVAFSKRCGMKIEEMVRDSSIYTALRHFRAGIEGTISFLKRVVGLERCTWRSLASFHSYIMSSVAAANLLLLARHRLAT
ncbi:MAG: ISNCY family transposase [Candidatus Eisenbacteria bacterium]|uniref:ISNCY family transposase n=1 Tax=Eiseniibacteriota bacterium TaxID=2212470 RepID=A0A956SFQ5_UNCEI|nr:ISNCY family transposase [Candidatus Eisenbacteria bacterium]